MSVVEHYVYRCYDSADRLLYVGCTENVSARMAVHDADRTNPASWAVAARGVKVAVETLPDKATALDAEREAIYNEAPMFNVHHQKVRRTPAENRAAVEAYLTATRPVLDPETAARIQDVFANFGRAAVA